MTVASAQRQVWVEAGLMLLATTTLRLLSWLVGSGITQRLNGDVLAMGPLADGDLTREIKAQGSDEVATMLRQLATGNWQLTAMQDALCRMTAAMRDSAFSVATASAQMAQGNANLWGRTEQQSASLQRVGRSRWLPSSSAHRPRWRDGCWPAAGPLAQLPTSART